MIAHAFHHRFGPAVADAKPFFGASADINFPGGGIIEGHIAHNDVILGDGGISLLGLDAKVGARQPFGKIVIGLAL